jgi:hypothetical protein
MKRRRSNRVRLVALGTVLVAGCSDEIPTQRYVYPTKQACVTEWGDTNCSAGNFSDSGGAYVGPRYGTWVNLPTGERIWSGTPRTPSFHPKTGQHLGAGAMAVSRSNSSGSSSSVGISGGGSSSNVSRGGFGSSGHAASSGG